MGLVYNFDLPDLNMDCHPRYMKPRRPTKGLIEIQRQPLSYLQKIQSAKLRLLLLADNPKYRPRDEDAIRYLNSMEENE